MSSLRYRSPNEPLKELRVKGLDNVFPALEIIDLPNGSQAIVMDKANGKIGNELTKTETDNIPQEHWNKLEETNLAQNSGQHHSYCLGTRF